MVKVLCCNMDQGCSWSGLLKDIDVHMATECPERTISCEYCGASVISKALQVGM